MEMINRSHKRAFSLLLLSKERLLEFDEQSFLDEHLSTCSRCRSQAQTHARMQTDLKSHAYDSYHTGLQHTAVLSGIVNSVDRRRNMRKMSGIALSLAKVGLVIVLIGAFLVIINDVLPIQLLDVIPGSETLGTKAIPNASSSSQASSASQLAPTSALKTEVTTYIVQQGDTMFEIAKKFQLKPETILWGNLHIFTDYSSLKLTPGMELNILPVDGIYYEWQEVDDLKAVASQFGVLPEDIMDWPGNHINPETFGDLSQSNIEPGTMLVVPGGSMDFPDWSAPPLYP
jgi:predicted anti-sigma-YlaC factor YlaD